MSTPVVNLSETMVNPISCWLAGWSLLGFVSGELEWSGETLYAGELQALDLFQPYQRQGVGGRLLLIGVRRLIREGMTSWGDWSAKPRS